VNIDREKLIPEAVTVRLLGKDSGFDYSDDVRALFLDAGWIGESDDTSYLPAMLRNSFCVTGAFYKGHLIGMMRALSDGVSDAYLLDMVVLTPYRGNGIALRILECLVAYLKSLGIDWLVCISVPGAEKLYLKLGEKMDEHIPIRFH